MRYDNDDTNMLSFIKLSIQMSRAGKKYSKEINYDSN